MVRESGGVVAFGVILWFMNAASLPHPKGASSMGQQTVSMAASPGVAFLPALPPAGAGDAPLLGCESGPIRTGWPR